MDEFGSRSRNLWHNLTLFVSVGKILVILGIGMWVAALSVPEKFVSEETILYYYEDTYGFMQQFAHVFPAFGQQDTALLREYAKRYADEHIEKLRWETRNRIRKYANWLFWPGLVTWLLFIWIRSEPTGFDASLMHLPDCVNSRIPYLLVRWQWKSFDADQQMIKEGLCRTVKGASKRAASVERCARAAISEESGYEEYRNYLKERARLGRFPKHA